jgi:hypothetical protein
VRFPQGGHEDACRARVVNLDLNSILEATVEGGEIEFPVLNWVRKFSELHAKSPRRPWTLLLTLHGEVKWTGEVSAYVQEVLKDNFAANQAFSGGSKKTLGAALFSLIDSPTPCDFAQLKVKDQQKVLMLFVPKRIAQLVNNQHWNISTRNCLMYGGGQVAPMVTWVLEFDWDQKLARQPNQLYKVNVSGVPTNTGSIDTKGRIHLHAEP